MDHHIVIAGAGGIGRAVGLLLANYPEIQGSMFIGDRFLPAAEDAVQWISEGRIHPISINAFQMPVDSLDSIAYVGRSGGVLLDCLPGSEAPRMARFALEHDMHYVNLTEYVKETDEITQLAANASRGFILQTGLAPGFINVLARKLHEQFVEHFHVGQVEHIAMRVGAITEHTQEPHYYGFTWSPIGVATEYVKASVCLENGEVVEKPALSERETLIIDGVTYEADLTSGGASDLPSHFQGISKGLDYKTIRYPGHYSWVESVIRKSATEERPVEALEKAMLDVIPVVEDDLIIVYASVMGRDNQGVLRKVEKAMKIGPTSIGGKRLRAIQSTTAAPMAECTRMLLKGETSGVVLQSQVDVDDFITGPFVERVYGRHFERVDIPVGA